MLEIHKIIDIEIIKQLATELQIEYNEKDIFLGAFVDGKLSEYVYYKKVDGGFSIIDVSDKSNDFQIIIGLIKPLIFYVDLAMLEKLILPLKYERIAKAIGFVQTDNAYELKLSEYQKRCECI